MITWKYSLSHHACKQVFISFFSLSLFFFVYSYFSLRCARGVVYLLLLFPHFQFLERAFFWGVSAPLQSLMSSTFCAKGRYSSFCTNPLFTLLRLEFIMTRLTHRFRGEFFLFALLGFVLDLIYNLSNMSP